MEENSREVMEKRNELHSKARPVARARSGPFPGSSFGCTLNNFPKIKPQHVSGPHQRFQARIALAALKKADHALGQSRALRQNRHRKAAFLTFFAQDARDVSSNLIHVGRQHARPLPRKGVHPADHNCNSLGGLDSFGCENSKQCVVSVLGLG